MPPSPERPDPAADAAPATIRLLWIAALTVAAFGAWVLFDAIPGINWGLWTGAAAAGLLLVARTRGRVSGTLPLLGGLATVIAGGAAVTASVELVPLICLAVMVVLAIAMLVAVGRSPGTLTAGVAVTAPLVAVKTAVVQALRRSAEATRLIRSTRARAWVRGLALTLPVLVVFALLLAGADPVFAAWRDAVGDLVANWDFVPRAIFFVALLVVTLGAYGHAAAEGAPAAEPAGPVHRWLGATERLILLAGIAALFWLFLVIQVGYLFGNLPQLPASGITFAEYARRGFAELSVVASASAILIVLSERYGQDEGRRGVLHFLTFTVLAAVLLLLASAFRRVWLYEAAYGFTTMRLYAQVYMAGVAIGLALLALEIAGGFDPGRLFRRAAGAAAILFVGLIYWNHEAWIARQNLDRWARTGVLDVAYLTRGLSPDALPVLAERLPSLPEPLGEDLRRRIRERYDQRLQTPTAWFEWNLARSRARRALEAM